ncbi:hypothetical protein ES708_17897 [subsurface metagenome]
MSIKHKAVKATLDVGTAVEWNDDHIVNYESCISHEMFFMSPGVAVMWDTAETAGTGVAPVLTFTDHHVIVELDSGPAGNDVSSMRHEFNGGVGNITHVNDEPILSAAVWLEQYPVGTECIEWGFFDSGVAPFTANQDGAYFRIDTNAIYAVTGDGAAETATDITPVAGIPEYINSRIELNGTNCLFYLNDMDTASATHTTNLPDSDLTIKYSCKNIGGGGGNQVLLYTDGCALTRLRYTG